jgi:transcriptional regulator with XRE-family HTH domain
MCDHPAFCKDAKDRKRWRAQRLRAAGLTWRQVGERMGLSRGYVRELACSFSTELAERYRCGHPIESMTVFEYVRAQAAVDRLVELLQARGA